MKNMFINLLVWINDICDSYLRMFSSHEKTEYLSKRDPLYLSNLPFVDHRKKDDVRNSFNEYGNDILFFDDQLPHEFDMKIFRKYKLKKNCEYEV